MLEASILTAERISLADNAGSKKRILESAAVLLAKNTEQTEEQIFEKLLERERLGSTGLSGGVALPHARISGLNEPRAAFMRLANPVDFDAMDGQPIDLVVALIVPENANQAHLEILAQLAKLLGDENVTKALRQVEGASGILGLMVDQKDQDNAEPGNDTGSIQLSARSS